LKSSTETLQKAIDDYAVKLAYAETKLNEVENRLADIEIVLSEDVLTPDYASSDEEYASLQKQIEDMQAELDKPVEDTTAVLLQNKREVQEKIDACNKTLNSKATAESTRKRIEELKADEKRVAGLITELEGHKYLLEQFVVTKVNLLESNINSRFKYVRFKMFDVQVNGGINECCETVFDGVPYSDLNNAARINIGLDIINTLSEHYNFSAPTFVDNRECVTRLIDVDAQVISLVVSEPDKKLRTELESEIIKEAI
jgi:hypothetical protein